MATDTPSGRRVLMDEVILGLSGELDPAVVRPASDRQFLAVVMPMRI